MLLEKLSKYPMLVITRNARHIPKLHPKSRVLQPMKFPRILRLCSLCRTYVIAQPNYSDGLSERTLYAMHRGAAVLTTTNNEIETAFRPGLDLLTLAQPMAREAAAGGEYFHGFDDRLQEPLSFRGQFPVGQRGLDLLKRREHRSAVGGNRCLLIGARGL